MTAFYSRALTLAVAAGCCALGLAMTGCAVYNQVFGDGTAFWPLLCGGLAPAAPATLLVISLKLSDESFM